MRNETLQELLISLQRNGISDPRVLQAMARTPREMFISDSALKEHAYADEALPIECEQTISQPFVVAFMTERLHLTPDNEVLEIGTGSGYQAAILSRLARHVYTIETHDELHRLATGEVQRAWPHQHHGNCGRRHTRLAGVPAVRANYRHRRDGNRSGGTSRSARPLRLHGHPPGIARRSTDYARHTLQRTHRSLSRCCRCASFPWYAQAPNWRPICKAAAVEPSSQGGKPGVAVPRWRHRA